MCRPNCERGICVRRFFRRRSSFVGSVFVNLLLNGGWILIAIGLLVLHYVIEGFPIWPFWAMIIVYVLIIIGATAILFWAAEAGGNIETKPRENKNPYSSKGYTPLNKKHGQ